ncbi:hypothetical protein JGF25_23495, partial [Salmonella enterica subsp. enterica serovar Mbandaka]|nr:hypothetical protein [Salmonella enterica subsp. enterica serovar Mbandaka]
MDELMQVMKEMTKNLSEKMEKQSEGLCEKMAEQNKELSEKLAKQSKELSGKFERLEKQIEESKRNIKEWLCQQEQRLEEKLSQQEQRLREEFETELRAYQQPLQVLHPASTPVQDEVPVDADTIPPNRVATKPAPYDGTTSWSVYKTQFEVIAEANGWRNREKACFLAASLRSPAADVLQTLPEEKRLDYESLVSALDLRFGGSFLQQLHAIQLRNRA